MKNCAAIIVNYNTGELLKKSVELALINEAINEVIVVDNLSTDNSMELLPNDNKLTTIYNKQNLGFASGCNIGAINRQSKYLLFLNPDCLITQNTISELILDLEHNPNSAIAGCLIKNPNGTEQRATRRRLPTFFRALKTLTKIENLAKLCACFAGVNLSHTKMPKITQKVEAISGALILIKADVFEKIKGFDESYTLHFEDLDLFKRTHDAGYEILFNPLVSAIHHQGTSSQFNPKVAQFKKQGLKRYFKKHCSSLSYKLIKYIF